MFKIASAAAIIQPRSSVELVVMPERHVKAGVAAWCLHLIKGRSVRWSEVPTDRRCRTFVTGELSVSV